MAIKDDLKLKVNGLKTSNLRLEAFRKDIVSLLKEYGVTEEPKKEADSEETPKVEATPAPADEKKVETTTSNDQPVKEESDGMSDMDKLVEVVDALARRVEALETSDDTKKEADTETPADQKKEADQPVTDDSKKTEADQPVPEDKKEIADRNVSNPDGTPQAEDKDQKKTPVPVNDNPMKPAEAAPVASDEPKKESESDDDEEDEKLEEADTKSDKSEPQAPVMEKLRTSDIKIRSTFRESAKFKNALKSVLRM